MENLMSKLNDEDEKNHDKVIRNDEIIHNLHYLSFFIFRTMIPVYLGKYGLILNLLIYGLSISNLI